MHFKSDRQMGRGLEDVSSNTLNPVWIGISKLHIDLYFLT